MSRPFGPRQLRWLSAYSLLLASASFIAAVVGLATARPAMALFAFPMCAFFLFGSWVLSPSHVRNTKPLLALHQQRFFDWLGIEWLSGARHRGSKGEPDDR
jgi:hypothetical protein